MSVFKKKKLSVVTKYVAVFRMIWWQDINFSRRCWKALHDVITMTIIPYSEAHFNNNNNTHTVDTFLLYLLRVALTRNQRGCARCKLRLPCLVMSTNQCWRNERFIHVYKLLDRASHGEFLIRVVRLAETASRARTVHRTEQALQETPNRSNEKAPFMSNSLCSTARWVHLRGSFYNFCLTVQFVYVIIGFQFSDLPIVPGSKYGACCVVLFFTSIRTGTARYIHRVQ